MRGSMSVTTGCPSGIFINHVSVESVCFPRKARWKSRSTSGCSFKMSIFPASTWRDSWRRPQLSNSRSSMPPRQFFDIKPRRILAYSLPSLPLSKTMSDFLSFVCYSAPRKAKCSDRFNQQYWVSLTASPATITSWKYHWIRALSSLVMASLWLTDRSSPLSLICLSILSKALFDHWNTSLFLKMLQLGRSKCFATWRIRAALAARYKDRLHRSPFSVRRSKIKTNERIVQVTGRARGQVDTNVLLFTKVMEQSFPKWCRCFCCFGRATLQSFPHVFVIYCRVPGEFGRRFSQRSYSHNKKLRMKRCTNRRFRLLFLQKYSGGTVHLRR